MESPFQQIDDLGHNEEWNDERTRVLFQQSKALIMVPVVGVDVGVQRPRVDQKGYGFTSACRISSIRSETSGVPLRSGPPPPR